MESGRGTKTLRTLVAVAAGMACLAVPTAAQALPSSEPEYGVDGDPQPMPDLTVTATVEVDSSVNYQGRVIREVTIWFTVKNIGKKAAGPFTLLQRVNHHIWYGSGGYTGERILSSGGLAAGASQRFSLWISDEHCVKALAVADYGKRVVEFDEYNNHRYVVSESYPGVCS